MWTIPLKSEDFPAGFAAKFSDEILVDELDLFWAAITAGRPKGQPMYPHGQYSRDEAMYRIGLLKANLRLASSSSELKHSPAFNALDPTEKGWVNFSLGMTFTKICAAKFLNVAWLMHYKWFEATNGVLTGPGKSTPDFIGIDPNKYYHVLEAKGRNSQYSANDLSNAKLQSDQIILVNGQSTSLHIGLILYRLESDGLAVVWRDPEPTDILPEIQLKESQQTWREYYRVAWGLHNMNEDERKALKRLTGLSVRLVEPIAKHVKTLMEDENNWGSARNDIKNWAASDEEKTLRHLKYKGTDKRVFADGLLLEYDRPSIFERPLE